MYALNRYLIKEILSVTILLIGVLTLLLWLTQSVRFLEILLGGSGNFALFLKFLSLTIPNILIVVIPIAIGVGVLFVFNKLINERELVVMRAVGWSNLQFIKPVIGMGGLFTIVLSLLTFYIAPLAEDKLQQMRAYFAQNVSIAMLKTGQFNHFNDMTIYVDSKISDQTYQDVLVVDNRIAGQQTTIVAERVELSPQAHGLLNIQVYNGYRQEKNLQSDDVDQFAFGSYQIDYTPREKISIYQKAKRAMTLTELNQMIEMRKAKNGKLSKLYNEKYSRFGAPLYALVFAIGAAYFMIYSSFRRVGQAKQILSVVLFIAIFQGWILVQSALIRKIPALYPIYWLVPLAALIGLGALMLYQKDRLEG